MKRNSRARNCVRSNPSAFEFCRNKMNNIVRIQPMQYIHLLDLVGTFISKFSFWVGCTITWSELCKSILLIVDRSFRRGSSWFDVLFCKIISSSHFEACCSVYWPGFCSNRAVTNNTGVFGIVRVCSQKLWFVFLVLLELFVFVPRINIRAQGSE